MIPPSLTPKQLVVLEFIQRYFSEHRKSPLLREIQVGCQIISYKSAIDRLNALEHKGFIRRTPNKHRGIRILRKASAGLQSEVTVESSLQGSGEEVPT